MIYAIIIVLPLLAAGLRLLVYVVTAKTTHCPFVSTQHSVWSQGTVFLGATRHRVVIPVVILWCLLAGMTTLWRVAVYFVYPIIWHTTILRGNWSTGFLDYILPQNPGGFRIFSEISVRTKQALPVGIRGVNRLLSFAPADFRSKSEPVPRTQVLSYMYRKGTKWVQH